MVAHAPAPDASKTRRFTLRIFDHPERLSSLETSRRHGW
jgi:hypothetical protein